jgi:itaconate CoA-transferase
MKPLDGILVVSIEQAIAAPFCTRQLADRGARVIKIERPDGGDFARAYDARVGGISSHFAWVNRSKESLALDLKTPEDMAVLQKLLQKADVLVQNLAPGAAARLGLTFEHLKGECPRLIVCDISGYGRGGPYSHKKAYDLLIQSEAGLLSVTGAADNLAKAGCSIADISAGMYAYSAILAAIIERNRTGSGRNIEISMFECMVEWMGFPLYYTYDGASPPVRAGAEHATIFPYGPFRAGDGRMVMLGVQNEREWVSLCRHVLSRPDLIDHPNFATNYARSQNRHQLRTFIEAAFAPFSADEVAASLERAEIATAAVNELQDVWRHPQLSARQRWVSVNSAAGWIPALLPPGAANASEVRMDAIPALGEHNAEILAELGIALGEAADPGSKST